LENNTGFILITVVAKVVKATEEEPAIRNELAD
jgi:hypothetical protein